MINNDEKVAIPSMRDKHVGIYSAINSMNSVEESLGKLISRIEGSPESVDSECEAPKATEVSLVDVIKGSEECIRNHIDSMHAKINDIEQLIF